MECAGRPPPPPPETPPPAAPPPPQQQPAQAPIVDTAVDLLSKLQFTGRLRNRRPGFTEGQLEGYDVDQLIADLLKELESSAVDLLKELESSAVFVDLLLDDQLLKHHEPNFIRIASMLLLHQTVLETRSHLNNAAPCDKRREAVWAVLARIHPSTLRNAVVVHFPTLVDIIYTSMFALQNTTTYSEDSEEPAEEDSEKPGWPWPRPGRRRHPEAGSSGRGHAHPPSAAAAAAAAAVASGAGTEVLGIDDAVVVGDAIADEGDSFAAAVDDEREMCAGLEQQPDLRATEELIRLLQLALLHQHGVELSESDNWNICEVSSNPALDTALDTADTADTADHDVGANVYLFVFCRWKRLSPPLNLCAARTTPSLQLLGMKKPVVEPWPTSVRCSRGRVGVRLSMLHVFVCTAQFVHAPMIAAAHSVHYLSRSHAATNTRSQKVHQTGRY